MKVTETKTTIIKTIDGLGPLSTLISIVPSATARSIDLVIGATIGATYSSRCASHLGKEGLGELIKILQEVHDAMVDV